MFGAGGSRSFIWSRGGVGTEGGVVRCDLAGYQPQELKLPKLKTYRLFKMGPSPKLRVQATMQRIPT
jgi:hypothetical protein